MTLETPKVQNQKTPRVKRQQTNQPKINLLIINPSPRNIKIFQTKLDLLNKKYDVFREKYNFNEVDAYKQCRDFFLSHTEYTHLAILPDDLLIDVKHVDKLVSDLEKYDYQILSGICNFALSTVGFYNNITAIEYTNYGAVDELARTGRYNYRKQIMSRARLNEIKESMKDKEDKIIRVAWSAFPFTIIRRDVVEKIEFTSNLMGVDTAFFQSVLQLGIPAYADLDVQSLHIKGIEKNKKMSEAIGIAWNHNTTTVINYSKFNPPKNEHIFLPKINEITE